MDLELYIERVEQYEQGLMPEAERSAFEAELASNAELRQALELYRLGQEVIEQGVETQLRRQLQGWAASDTGTAAAPLTARRVTMRPMWMRLAAAASVALILGWFSIQWVSRDYSDEALFAAQYEAPDTGTSRSGVTLDNPLETGFKALENNNLQAAEDFFKSIQPDNERYAEAQYYLGHTAGQLKHYDLAIAAFQSSIQRNEAKFQEKAEWNLLLAYLAAGQTDNADFQNLLNRIAGDPNHAYQKRAEALQGKLGSFLRKFGE
jgi:tetratricopeptide (TPR) repeat protein